MIWRISKSRPSTGSILPLRAFSVRLTVNWSRLGVLPPGLATPGAPGAPAAATGSATYSSESARMAGICLRRASGSIFCNSLLISRTMRARSSRETSARMVTRAHLGRR